MPKSSETRRLGAWCATADLPAGSTEHIVRDDTLTGYSLRIRKASSRYLLFGNLDGRRRTWTIGDAQALPPKQARAIAADWRNLILQGIDPTSAPDKAVTFGDMQARYRARWVKGKLARQKRAPRPDSIRSFDSDIRRAVSTFGARPVADIDTAACRRFLSALEREDVSPAVRRRSFGALHQVLRFAVGEGEADQDPTAGLDTPAASSARERYLSRDELAAIWHACADQGIVGDVTRFLIAMPVRLGVAREMRHDWIDDDLLSVPASATGNKAARDLVLPLTRQAIALIDRQATKGQVFAGLGGAQVTMGSRQKARIAAAAGVDGWRFHDFRRSCVSLLADAVEDVDIDAADQWLGHVRTGIVAVYQKSNRLAAMRRIAAHWSDILDDLTG